MVNATPTPTTTIHTNDNNNSSQRNKKKKKEWNLYSYVILAALFSIITIIVKGTTRALCNTTVPVEMEEAMILPQQVHNDNNDKVWGFAECMLLGHSGEDGGESLAL